MLEIKFNQENTYKECSKLTMSQDCTEAAERLLPGEEATENEIISEVYNLKNHPAAHSQLYNSQISSCCYKLNNCILGSLAIIFFLLAALLCLNPLMDIVNSERLKLRPGLQVFEEWLKPEPILYCYVYIFTVTNSEAFLKGTDKKLQLKELGPVIYREHFGHSEVVFNKNSTLTYRIRRHLEFLPELNRPGILNETIIVPNIALLGMASLIANAMFTVKMPFNILSRNDPAFANTTVYNYLWNFTTPALETVGTYLPFLVPVNNTGPLHAIYQDFDDYVNARIGPKYTASEFLLINTFDNRPTVPGYRPENGQCYANLVNSTEGTIYPSSLTKDQVVYYWRKTVCRPVPLFFEREVQKGYLLGYKMAPKINWLDRLDNLTADCYKGLSDNFLPNGLSDISKCFYGLPLAVSAPHFYGYDGPWNDKLNGLKPNPEVHSSYSVIEPMTGVPLEQSASLQNNLVLPRLYGFNNEINRFSKIIVPNVWIKYYQPELTTKLNFYLYILTKILPILQYIVPVIFSIISFLCYLMFAKRINRNDSFGKIYKFRKLWQKKKEISFKKS